MRPEVGLGRLFLSSFTLEPFPSFLNVYDPDTLKRAGLFCAMTLRVGLSGVSWGSAYSATRDVRFYYWIKVASARLLWHESLLFSL